MLLRTLLRVLLAALLAFGVGVTAADSGKRVTILCDAFASSPALTKDWGFAAYIEYGGKRILFDTGNDAHIFAHNVQAAGVDLTTLDFAAISHRHLEVWGERYLYAGVGSVIDLP